MQQLSDITLDGLTDLLPIPSATDGNRARCRNRLLAALTPEAWGRIAPHLHRMELIVGDVLQESGAPIEQVYFVEEGLISQVTTAEGGSQVEVAITGKEGLASALTCLGPYPALHKGTVQVSGAAYRLSVAVLEEEYRRNPHWHQLLLHYVYALFAQASRSVLCNRTHTLEERLSRWLLLVRDCIESDTLPLRDEFVAQMLGVRRSSVTLALGVLQQAGLIDNTRGDILILNNEKLERTTCSCYRHIQNQLQHFEDAASA